MVIANQGNPLCVKYADRDIRGQLTKKEKLEFATNLLLQNQKDKVVKMFRRHRSSQSLKLPQNEDIMKSSESSQV